MKVKNWLACVVASCAIVASGAAIARDAKAGDEGKGSAFKSKTYEMKEGGELVVVLSFEAGKEVTVTTKGDQKTDVHLFVKGKYFAAKDVSPGPECLVKFTPVKGDEKFTFTIKNNGPGANKVTLQVQVAE